MSNTLFVPGQRWVSNTESELGLGIVIDVVNRSVEISFPAAGERRTYAMANAPVSRVRYEINQQVSNEEGLSITIDDVIDNRGLLIYSGLDERGETVILPELDLNSFVQFSKPQERLFAGQIDKNRAFAVRCETLEHINRQQQSPVQGLLGPRVQLLPHQLYIASEAANRHAPRVLLADEVGLGKTIEAGLILHQQLISGRAKRVLVVVPDSLLHQWLVEMLRRFNLYFTILDEARCEGLEERGEDSSYQLESDLTEKDFDAGAGDYNPFESAQLVLCTLSFLVDHPQRLKQACAADWDLLVVDEAHHLEWTESQPSVAYNCVEAIARRARGLLLLTATPEQLGVASHFARLRLLDPDRYYDLQAFIAEEESHHAVNKLVQALLSEDVLAQLQRDSALLDSLREILGDASLLGIEAAIAGAAKITVRPTLSLRGKSPLLKGSKSAKSSVAAQRDVGFSAALDELIDNLLDRHGTGRVLFRNTRSSVKGFPKRNLQTYPLVAAAAYSDAAVEASLDEQLAPELLLGSRWIDEDPRVQWLEQWLKQHRAEKVLVICARAKTALELEEYLRLRCGLQSTVFHEGLSLVARDRSAAYFGDNEDGAQVLICSEIGSEGRNFQFSNHLVLFDLPLNPDLLEQRIGRLDRIGQLNTVEIHVPYYEGSAQQVLLNWYSDGISTFERSCPAAQLLYRQFEQELRFCLSHSNDQLAARELIAKASVQTAETLEKLQAGRDSLLELSSCNHRRAEDIVENMMEEERRQELSSYMDQLFDLFGVEQEYHSAAAVVIRPGDHMLTHTFPALDEEGMTATFSRELALSREDLHYLSWEHPMVSGAMDMVLSGEFGNTAFCTLKLPPLKAGTFLLEAIFIVHCTAPAQLQLQRYLPLTTVRIVVDSNGTDLSAVLTAAHINKLGQKVQRRSAQELVAHAREQIVDMIDKSEGLANGKKDTIVERALLQMGQQQSSELQRLQALAAVNPNIRDEEVDYLQNSAASAQRYLQGAQLKLDAVRVAMVVE